MSTIQMSPTEVGSTSKSQSRQRQIKIVLLLASLAFSGAAFVALDWFYSAAILRSTAVGGSPSNCRMPDRVRHHALRPNCACIDSWGRDSYQVFANSLGFRDERIREVPLADARPRLLVLGDSFTEGMIAWRDSYVGRISAHFPQYDFLNGAVKSYSPSNYLNVARMLLAEGVEFDEVIVFMDISDTQDEAAFYHDVDATGAVTVPDRKYLTTNWYSDLRLRISRRLLLTSYIFELFEKSLVRCGYYHLYVGPGGDEFDLERSAWTYRKVSETDPYEVGYAPLGVEGGIAKERAKMTLLWQELDNRHIPISVVVYPWPAQVVHDTADSKQVRIWREWCEGKCKRFTSIFPVFLAARDQCPWSEPGCWYLRYFTFGDIHFNPAGNALVAEVVINNLAEVPPTKRQP